MGHGVIPLAYDSGPSIGLGHRRRMEALADSLSAGGASPALVSLDDGPVDGDVVVVDSYRIRADDRHAVRARAVVAVDDIGRDLDVDLVIDPSPGPLESFGNARVLHGLEYALLDPSLADRSPRAVTDAVDVVLVATGGTDTDGVGAAIARGIRDALDTARVRLVVGPWSSREVPDGVEPVQSDCGLADALAAADLVVTASGVTMLESLVLGRPTVAVVTADNQRRYHDGVVGAGGVVAVTVTAAAAAAVALCADVTRRRALSGTGRTLVDGRGAERVAEAVVALG